MLPPPWNQKTQKVSVDCSHCVSFFFLSLPTPFSFSSSMAKPPASFPSFSRFATSFSPFLQLALCPFPESSKKSEELEEEAPPQEGGIDSLFFSFLLFFVTPLLFFPFF